ncbi:MAG: methylated-DNA--[protein]-cysteine S-methyltransferase [Xanthomonadaceae bacterium]|nr:methylated-DNA--[protein]-cysteine S-methyltransferase [Xanthomonadaceae bacterium]
MPLTMAQLAEHIEAHAEQSLTLAELARLARLSPGWLQRRFKAEIGVSPRAYQHGIRMRRLRADLRAGDQISGAIYEAGFGSLSRVYEVADRELGMTPARYRRGGAGVQIHYAIRATRLGLLLMAATERGVCHVHFGDSASALTDDLAEEFPRATIVEPGAESGGLSIIDASAKSLTQSIAGSPEQANPELDDWMAALQTHIDRGTPRPDLPMHVFGTALQLRTWRFLTSIGDGETCNYSEVADAIGSPKAVRAVANACAANRIAVLIPCHRVLRKDGGVGGYRWGIDRKLALLDARRPAHRPPRGRGTGND